MESPSLWRALAAFALLPGIVAYAAPVSWALLSRWPHRYPGSGAALVLAGTILLLACVRQFYVAGRGTLAPWSPPQRLVTTGPYRLSRNPMYVAVITVLAGWATFFGQRDLAIYLLAVVCAFQLRVVLAEEPFAARVFGVEWASYRARTPRWLGRPASGSPHGPGGGDSAPIAPSGHETG